MKVTIDPGTLLFEIQRFNPEADLTGLKAYLFDLMTGLEDKPVTQAAKPAPLPPAVQPIEPTGDFLEPETALSQVLPVAVLGDAVAGRVHEQPPAKHTVKIDRSEREARRARARELSEMSSKEILEQLHQQKGPKPNENGQFVEGGAAGGGSGSDEAFG